MAVRNPPLYPRMRERPEHFRLNLASPLTPGLLYAVIPSVRCSANDEIWDLGSRVQFRREAGVGPVSLTWEQDIHRLGIAITDSSILQQNGYETIDTFAEGIFCFGWYRRRGGYWVVSVGPYPTNELVFGDANGRFDIDGSYQNYGDTEDSRQHAWIMGKRGGAGYYSIDGRPYRYLGGSVRYHSSRTAIGRGEINTRGNGVLSDLLLWRRYIDHVIFQQLADPNNVDLRVGTVPLILPSRRMLWPSVIVEPDVDHPVPAPGIVAAAEAYAVVAVAAAEAYAVGAEAAEAVV